MNYQTKPGIETEKDLIEKWLIVHKHVGFFGGYPLGGSSLDSRCLLGADMLLVKLYTEIDHDVAKKLPHLKGFTREHVEAYYEKKFK
ncbi:MAG: hypothetical protein DWB56_07985 [Candidatus Jettenia sp.]|uniref:Uncharacterized protein n=1 Tax=Candidatus Jettenia caeni TaxID=247490 RepID=I3IJD5_9BACT|nr:hypothetical protein [Candidatus Jettenia sp. AMX1]MBC6928885.1 hypothetical protein [Candidatus Jettenia sp.]GAB61830.1 hypothetical protein KSU1_C0234 [Candidatus Jettenia caeni]KAA0250871.1 MAG: hypothetical protein EDM77_03430 [Candidatus Jettenia sp. AMX1]MCE7879886.1 hypothetical protein [Candidatus Jettenia sp. AMX1]MCQ3926665.1 hypothetical protein [Candidatus Jettenia sp.]